MCRRLLPKVLLALVLAGAIQPTIATPREATEDRPQLNGWLVEFGEQLRGLIEWATGSGTSSPPPPGDGPPSQNETGSHMDPNGFEQSPSPTPVA